MVGVELAKGLGAVAALQQKGFTSDRLGQSCA